jgi:signal transduction histidine kinase/CheY-like chemotaxis protein
VSQRSVTWARLGEWASRRTWGALAGLNLLVALAYWGVAEIMLLPTTQWGQSVAPVWASAGIAAVAVWFWGARVLPGVVLGVLAFRLARMPLLEAAAATAGPAVEAFLFARLLQVMAFDDRLQRVRDPLILSLSAAPLASLIGANIAIAGTLMVGDTPAFGTSLGWLRWWLQDWLGIVVVAMLVFATVRRPAIAWTRPRVMEATLLAVAILFWAIVLAVLWGVFDRDVPLAFVFFPIVSWTGLRFGAFGVAVVVAVLTGLAMAVIYAAIGPFSALSLSFTQIVLFLFLMLASVSGHVLAALNAERDEALQTRLQLEEQLRHSQKLEAVGRLAGGIAHDFNNLLTAIIGYSELVLTSLDPKDERRADAEEIGRAAMRAADLTRQMLAFSRRQVMEPRTVDLNTTVTRLLPMLRRLIGEDVLLVVDRNAVGPLVRVDPGQMEQVIVNLVVNARDAMPKGGRLSLETADVVLDAAAAAEIPDARPGPHVLLTLSDTGTGMSPEVRARVFEPYFTTKEAGKGTGLGLSTAYGIVRQSDGHITVESQPGVGTTFRILLPRASGAAAEEPDATIQKLPGGSEHVLLVEDDPSVRRLTRDLLTRLGYSVTEAASGRAGIALGSDDTRHFELAVCDVILGDVSGPAVAEALQALRPSTRVLFISGYPDDAIVRTGVLNEGRAFLQKPFTPIQLARKIREVLEDQEAGVA